MDLQRAAYASLTKQLASARQDEKKRFEPGTFAGSPGRE